MIWYYANAGQQNGPVTQSDFERLAREGVILPTTLVWHEGLANWQPYASTNVAPAAKAPTENQGPAPEQILCDECRQFVPAGDTMQIGGATICAACKPCFVQKLREGALPPMTEGPRYAGFWIRVAAKIIDSLIIGLPIGLLMLVAIFGFGFKGLVAPAGPPTLQSMLPTIGLQLGFQALIMILNGFYTVWFVYKYSATPGKMVCGLRVLNADGSKLSLGKNIGRYGAEIVSGLACDLGYVIAGFDSQKRALHDHMCNTRVIYKQQS